MSNKLEMPPQVSVHTAPTTQRAVIEQHLKDLRTEGIIVLPDLLPAERLRSMQTAFEVKLRRLRWNNFDGYQKTEPYRHMVEDVLLLDQGFVDLAVNPVVKAIVTEYIGPECELTEAKGWKSLPTQRDFHGWHGDAWYDSANSADIHKELKVAFYLTDVKSGGFNYIRGTHRQQHPRPVKNFEIANIPEAQITNVLGAAGTAIIFDTSGIHRQGVPMLEPRQAVFYNYHNPSVPLQQEDIDYYRYHPLLLNAAFLGNLGEDDRCLLGFGNQTNYIPAFSRYGKPPLSVRALSRAHNIQLRARHLRDRVTGRLKLILK